MAKTKSLRRWEPDQRTIARLLTLAEVGLVAAIRAIREEILAGENLVRRDARKDLRAR
jgi:hypothetical protein